MLSDFIPFGSTPYWIFFSILFFSRGMDFLSTWIATPNLVLEANPIARRLGWRGGAVVNAGLCLVFALMPLAAIMISTSSCLVAARNFQSACLMRALGELEYNCWHAERIATASPLLFLFCLAAQCGLVLLIGGVVIWFSANDVVFGIGLGMVAYAIAVALFTTLARFRRSTLPLS